MLITISGGEARKSRFSTKGKASGKQTSEAIVVPAEREVETVAKVEGQGREIINKLGKM